MNTIFQYQIHTLQIQIVYSSVSFFKVLYFCTQLILPNYDLNFARAKQCTYSMYSNQCFHIFMFFLSDDSSADVKQGVRKEGRKARKRDCYEPPPIWVQPQLLPDNLILSPSLSTTKWRLAWFLLALLSTNQYYVGVWLRSARKSFKLSVSWEVGIFVSGFEWLACLISGLCRRQHIQSPNSCHALCNRFTTPNQTSLPPEFLSAVANSILYVYLF